MECDRLGDCRKLAADRDCTIGGEYVDNGSAVTLVTDPVDGTANAAAGVPLSAFAGVIAVDQTPTEALTCWLDTGRCWHTVAGQPTPYRTSGRAELNGAAVSLLRPPVTASRPESEPTPHRWSASLIPVLPADLANQIRSPHPARTPDAGPHLPPFPPFHGREFHCDASLTHATASHP